jgi:uncharacterized protein
MHINVHEFLAEDVGYNRTFAITGERPTLNSVTLTQPVNGSITISRIDEGVLVEGDIETEIELECHRCLRTFARSVAVSFAQIFAEAPTGDDMPIIRGDLDLAPLIEQEILVNLPIKLLCRPDCPGVEGVEDQYSPAPASSRLKDKARITKGSHRGRS